MSDLQVCVSLPLYHIIQNVRAIADVVPTNFRIRKVKCDEEKPCCRRCRETGRRCEGPTAQEFRFIHDRPAVSKESGPHPELSLVAPQHGDDERRAFHYFRQRAAPVFAGVIDASFWLDLVPRLAHSSPFVWDAVVSISWLFEHVPYEVLTTNFEPQKSSSIVSPDHGKAIKWYNRGIASLRQHIEQGGIDTPLALLSCILFASLEFQQRNVGNALSLMETGYKLMGQSLAVSSTSPLSATSIAIHEVVTPFFSRHAVLMATLGTPLPPDWTCHLEETMVKPSVLASLSVLDGPRAQLYSLIYRAYEIIRVENLMPTEDHVIKMQRLKQSLLLQDLRRWEMSFVDMLSPDTRSVIGWAASNLLMYWGVCYIWLSTCTSPLQTAFDEHLDRFATILAHAEKVLRYTVESTTGQPIFNFEIGLIPPVYFCATKCRDPLLRRKALELMRQAPTRESLWAAVATERIVDKVIATEEGDCYASYSYFEGMARPLPLPPEENRIHHVAVVRKDFLGGIQRLALQLTKCVAEPDGSKRMVNENVWLD